MVKFVHKYKELFQTENLKQYSTYKLQFNAIWNLIEEKFSHTDILNWSQDDYDSFLLSIESISPSTLIAYDYCFHKFYKFVCDKENKPYKKFEHQKWQEYISVKNLRAKTITEQEYNWIRNQFVDIVGGRQYNTRDRLIIELAWHTLTKSEIAEINMYKDIEEVRDKITKEIKKVKLNINNRENPIIITDPQTIADIQQVKKDTEHFKIGLQGREMYVPYRDTEYLIRPAMQKVSEKTELANPSLIIKNAFRNDIIPPPSNPYLDLYYLSLEDIRRSRIMHEFHKHPDTIPLEMQQMLDRKTQSDLYWLKDVVGKVYNYENTPSPN